MKSEVERALVEETVRKETTPTMPRPGVHGGDFLNFFFIFGYILVVLIFIQAAVGPQQGSTLSAC